MRTLHLSPLAAAALLAAGCLAPRHEVTPSSAAMVIDVPTVSQEKADECGLASLAMLCVHYGVAVPDDVLVGLRAAAANGRGLSGAEIRDALRACGLEVHVFEGTLDEDSSASLYHQLDRSRPVLVQIGGDDGELLHAGLITGYDPVEEQLRLLDPRRGPCWLPVDRFASAWAEANHFALVAVPPTDLDDVERERLQQLERVADEDLAQQAAGDVDVDNDGLTTVFLVLGIVVLVVILL
jgi:ABC-type bacteriocin/lantibiotic exporter with double-glycine peptidase domain